MRMRAVAVGASVLALAACGGGGGGTRLSRDAYITKANAICAKLAAERKALKAPTSLAEEPPYIDRALPLLDAGLSDLGALKPPANMETSVDALLQAAGQVRDLLAQLRTAAKKGDSLTVAKVGSQALQLNNQIQSRARALGATGCTSL